MYNCILQLCHKCGCLQKTRFVIFKNLTAILQKPIFMGGQGTPGLPLRGGRWCHQPNYQAFLLKGRTWKKTKISLIIGLVEIPYVRMGTANLRLLESAKRISGKSAKFIYLVLFNFKTMTLIWRILSLINSI